MAFDWAEDISSGAKIHAADLIEIRTNIDTVDDEKCAAHWVAVDSNYKDSEDTTNNPGYYSGQNSGHYSGQFFTYKPANCPGQLFGYNANVT